MRVRKGVWRVNQLILRTGELRLRVKVPVYPTHQRSHLRDGAEPSSAHRFGKLNKRLSCVTFEIAIVRTSTDTGLSISLSTYLSIYLIRFDSNLA